MQQKLHKIISILVVIIGIAVKTVAQNSYVVLQDSKHNVRVSSHTGNIYKWGVYSDRYGNDPAPENVYRFENDINNTNEIDIIFTSSGEYYLIVSETGIQGCTTRRSIKFDVKSNDNATANITANNEWICSKNNGEGENSSVKLRVNYSGLKPWTFKYSVNKAPPIQPEGTDEINSDYFDFELSYRNETSRTKEYEVSLVDIKPVLGTPLKIDDGHTATFKVLPLSVPKLSDYESIILAESIKNYKIEINKNSQCKIILPNEAELSNEHTYTTSDGQTHYFDFDVQWGKTLGDYQIKIIEQNALNCNSDTIYADITLVNNFKISLGDDIETCNGEKIELIPIIDLQGNYTYLWSNNSTGNTLKINESGMYSVTATNIDSGDSNTASVNVTIHTAPTVDLGEDITLYNGETIELNAGFIDEKTIYQWNTGDTTQKITVSNENIYLVKVTDEHGCQNTDEINVTTKVGQEFSVYLGDNQEICDGDSIYLEPIIDRNLQEPTYKWTPSELTGKNIYVKNSGQHCVDVTDQFGNIASDCIMLTVNDAPLVNLGTDLTIQDGETVILDAKNTGSFYNWSTGEITQTIAVNEADQYYVEVTNQQYCVGRDSITVDYYNQLDQFVGLPTGFSPNGDGINDVLYVRGKNIASIHLIIKNRLGQLVFQSKNQENGWDGTSQGKKQKMDVYVYMLKVTLLNGKTISKQGNVTLLN